MHQDDLTMRAEAIAAGLLQGIDDAGLTYLELGYQTPEAAARALVRGVPDQLTDLARQLVAIRLRKDADK